MKSKIFLSCLLFTWITLSCQEDTFLTYESEDQIYFNLTAVSVGQFLDSLNITFMYDHLDKTDSIVNIPVRVLGNLSPEKRSFAYSVDPASTAKEGVHFSVESTVIDPEQRDGFFKLKLNRTADLSEEILTLFLRLEENEFFSTDYHNWLNTKNDSIYDPVNFKIHFTDMFIAPARWSMYEYYLGPFSIKKMRLLSELMNVPLIDFEALSVAQYMGFGVALKRYLEQQKIAGNTIYEEDGSEMTAGAYAY